MEQSPQIENIKIGIIGVLAKELKFKVSYRSEFNWKRYRDISNMATLRHGVVTPN